MSKILIRDPFAPFAGQLAEQFANDFGSLFNTSFPRRSRVASAPTSSWTLPVNVYETDEGIGIEAWLPGFAEDEIAVTVDDGQLRIHAERASTDKSQSDSGDDRKYRRREVARTVLSRQFRLDPSYDASKISAKLANGVLELSLPKSEQAQPQRIEISSAPAVVDGSAEVAG